MAFEDIFNSLRNTSNIATETQTVLSGYLAKQPNEDITMPPHDPYQPPEKTQQDPKLIRETSPQAQAVFNHLTSLTSEVMKSSNNVEAASDNPNSVVQPGSGVMHTAYADTSKMHETVPTPGAKTPQPPKPSTPATPTVPDLPKPPEQTPDVPDNIKQQDQKYASKNA